MSSLSVGERCAVGRGEGRWGGVCGGGGKMFLSLREGKSARTDGVPGHQSHYLSPAKRALYHLS